ncbi:metal ABC transporter ATP-binding protein [Liberibacter crescens]|nr:ABC transporter ATP-binding protein [Liberibacter crescens]
MTKAITLHDLTLAYLRQPAVHHVNGSFLAGELSAIAGPNGAGKSTLLKAIAGILPIHEGSIEFHQFTRKDIAYLPQSAELELDFPINLLQIVASGFWKETKSFGQVTRAQREKSLKALHTVGLQGFEKRTLDNLSAGQVQRALFARLLVQDAQIILLDEPFTAIDAATTEVLLKITRNWHVEKRTVICVLHDFEQIRKHFTNCLLMACESIAWGKPCDVLTTQNLLRCSFYRKTVPDQDNGQKA